MVETTHKKKKYKTTLERIGLLGPPIAAITILDKIDIVITFNEYIEKFLESWHVWTAKTWNYILNIMGFSNITNIDAVFFTFLLMIFLSFVSSITIDERVLTRKEKILGTFFVILGLMIFSIIFTSADIATYEIDRQKYEQSIQYEVYKIYTQFLPTERFPATVNKFYLDAFLVFIFYAILSIAVFLISYIISRIFSVKINIWRFSRRIYLIIGFAVMVVIVNKGIYLLKYYYS